MSHYAELGGTDGTAGDPAARWRRTSRRSGRGISHDGRIDDALELLADVIERVPRLEQLVIELRQQSGRQDEAIAAIRDAVQSSGEQVGSAVDAVSTEMRSVHAAVDDGRRDAGRALDELAIEVRALQASVSWAATDSQRAVARLERATAGSGAARERWEEDVEERWRGFSADIADLRGAIDSTWTATVRMWAEVVTAVEHLHEAVDRTGVEQSPAVAGLTQRVRHLEQRMRVLLGDHGEAPPGT